MEKSTKSNQLWITMKMGLTTDLLLNCCVNEWAHTEVTTNSGKQVNVINAV